MSWTITDEDSYINIQEGSVSLATLPKEKVVLVICLAGEGENESGVNELHIKYAGKYTTKIPYTQVTVGASSASSVEDFRTKVLAYLNDLPAVGGSTALEYAAKISQSSTNAPVVGVEYENTTGTTFTWGYVNTGLYSITASGPVFTASNWQAYMNYTLHILDGHWYNVLYQSNTELRLYVYQTSALADDIIADNLFYLRIFT